MGILDRRIFKHAKKNTVGDYVKKQGKKDHKLYEDRQLVLLPQPLAEGSLFDSSHVKKIKKPNNFSYCKIKT